jgi:hypothetical protein
MWGEVFHHILMHVEHTESNRKQTLRKAQGKSIPPVDVWMKVFSDNRTIDPQTHRPTDHLHQWSQLRGVTTPIDGKWVSVCVWVSKMLIAILPRNNNFLLVFLSFQMEEDENGRDGFLKRKGEKKCPSEKIKSHLTNPSTDVMAT